MRKVLSANTPKRNANDPSHDHYWDELDEILEINHFDPHWKPALNEEQISTTANQDHQNDLINTSKSKSKAAIKKQTESRSERKKRDPEFKARTANHDRKYYYNHKKKLKETLTDQQLKQKSIEKFKKRQKQYGGFTSKRDQYYHSLKMKIENGQHLTKEEQEFFSQNRAKKAEYQRDYRLRKKIINFLSS